ncbi:uncharacterized protein LOC126840658 [Adelges cooleyi]|uniref:uncharacterized protein LOC126840658 n=1 Tax=Adelges cooleyi TaxID=133065 RepID=UPI00218039EB|nr:uncharacterized protein LOC126840658 [Adelges cooleyi]
MILGNITALVPLDDSLNFHLNMAVLDQIGGWKDNAYVYNHPKACSSLKFLMGETWTPLMRNFKLNSTDCPLPKGFYIMEGFDLSLFEKMNIPKQLYYGTYKMKIVYTDKSDVVVGCFIIVVEILRPWE